MEISREKTAIRCLLLAVSLFVGLRAEGQQKAPPPETSKPIHMSGPDEPMVDLALVCPAILVELRYATARNITGKPIYPANARCLVRQSVAQRLQRVQDELHAQGYGLKIWDAYRPAWAQKILWKAKPNPDFLQAPARGTSMHTNGVAIDATLVDLQGHTLGMPTDFDEFTTASRLRYMGADLVVARHLLILQTAMGNAGFLGMSNEWWHFVARDYAKSKPVEMDLQPEAKPKEPAVAEKAAGNQ